MTTTFAELYKSTPMPKVPNGIREKMSYPLPGGNTFPTLVDSFDFTTTSPSGLFTSRAYAQPQQSQRAQVRPLAPSSLGMKSPIFKLKMFPEKTLLTPQAKSSRIPDDKPISQSELNRAKREIKELNEYRSKMRESARPEWANDRLIQHPTVLERKPCNQYFQKNIRTPKI